MIQKFIVGFPVANVLKFTLDGENKDERASFDQQSYSLAEHAGIQVRDFCYPMEKTDPLQIQFYNNFPAVKVELLNVKGTVVQTLSPSVIVNYRNKIYRSDCRFSSINGKLFVYFDQGFEYSDEDFEDAGDIVDLHGRLPNINAQPGDIVRYKIGDLDFADSEIVSLAWLPVEQAHGYLLDVDSTLLNPVDGKIEIEYNEKPTNLYARDIDNSARAEGCYKVKVSFGLTTSNYVKSFTSEEFDLKEKHENSLAIKYSHEGTFTRSDQWKFVYQDGYKNVMRMPSEFYQFTPAGEVDVFNSDSGEPTGLRFIPYRQMLFKAFNIPSWLIDKLNVVFSHETKEINGYEWENENFGSKDQIERTDLNYFEIQVRQKGDRTLFENSFDLDVTASFSPPSHSVDFEAIVVQSTFISNTQSVFRFLTLPDWITPDKETFVNGDVINFTITENESSSFDRAAVLTAVTDDFDGLQATVSFAQTLDDTDPPPAEYLEVSDETVELGGGAGSNVLIDVDSSGDYNISFSGAFTFTAVKESGFLQVRISSPTANSSTTDRTGVVRLTLQSNPLIFKDIAVTQDNLNFLVGLTPALDTIDGSGGTIETDVNVLGTAQWQASSPDSWLSFSTFVHTGSYNNFPVLVEGKPPYISPRTGSVTFVNIANPSDTLTLIIQQTD